MAQVVTSLRSSFWLLPTLLVLGGVGLALGLTELDQRTGADWSSRVPWIFGGGAGGARGLLTAIASSMITVTGVTFSITVVSLALASQQYTPRVLREFTSDRGNQVVLGTFLATYVYALLVLRTIRTEDFGDFVPHLAVSGAVFLALVSVGLLVYFIDHVSSAIRPNSILSSVAAQGHGLIDHMFPAGLGRGPSEHPLESGPMPGKPGLSVGAPATGYVQALDGDRLLEVAVEHDLLVRMEAGIGDFISREAPLFTVWPEERSGDEVRGALRRCVSLAQDRTVEQDLEFVFLQIVDIALKALSPGINDPTTAKNCLDYLGDLLRHVGQRRIATRFRTDARGTLRVIACGTDFQRLADLAFDDIRRYAEGAAGVTLYLLRTIQQTGRELTQPERRAVLRAHVVKTAEGAEESIRSTSDLQEVHQMVGDLLELLEPDPSPDG